MCDRIFSAESLPLQRICDYTVMRLPVALASAQVNSILNSLCNISDVLAIDRRNYQGGDRIVCRVPCSAASQGTSVDQAVKCI